MRRPGVRGPGARIGGRRGIGATHCDRSSNGRPVREEDTSAVL
jgi:hypothetical protein